LILVFLVLQWDWVWGKSLPV